MNSKKVTFQDMANRDVRDALQGLTPLVSKDSLEALCGFPYEREPRKPFHIRIYRWMKYFFRESAGRLRAAYLVLRHGEY